MCHIEKGSVRGTGQLNVGSISVTTPNEFSRLGCIDPERINDGTDPEGTVYWLECRHRGGSWREVPFPKRGEVLIVEPLSELRLQGYVPPSALVKRWLGLS